MKRSKKNNRWKKQLISLTMLAILIPFSAKVLSETVPIVGDAAGKAAVISAGLALPEGGRTLLQEEIDQSPDEDTITPEDPIPSEGEAAPASETNLITDADIPPTSGITQEEIDQYPNNDGAVVRKTYTAGSTDDYINISGNAYVRNMTNLPNQTVIDAVHSPPAFTITPGTSEPQVLIMHTHTTESYALSDNDYYDINYPSRNLDATRNVVRVGDEITKQLEAAGIGVIHDTTVHDYPSYNGSYDRSKQTVETILAQYPSIKVVLDIHRDAIETDDGTRYAPVANIDGRNAAQIMIISGCDDGTMDYPNYLQNLAFASVLEQQVESDYPGLTRPISFKYKYYNQSLTTGSLLIEVGSNSNSLDEAIYSGYLLGKSLAKTLQGLTG